MMPPLSIVRDEPAIDIPTIVPTSELSWGWARVERLVSWPIVLMLGGGLLVCIVWYALNLLILRK